MTKSDFSSYSHNNSNSIFLLSDTRSKYTSIRFLAFLRFYEPHTKPNLLQLGVNKGRSRSQDIGIGVYFS